jgi:rhodanese-related sulfurtransferase
MRSLVSFLFLIWMVPFSIRAEVMFLAVEDAHRLTKSGEVTLIDVRSELEWRKTGIAAGAHPISIRGAGGEGEFLKAVGSVNGSQNTKPVAFICASGIRSGRAASLVEKAGFTSVFNVRAGMNGNRRDGPGWVQKKLPLKSWP